MANYEISILGTQGGRNIVNTHGLTIGDAFSPEDPAEAAVAAERAFLAWKQAFLVRLSSSYTALSAVARGVLDGGVSGVSTSGPQAGARAEPPMPTFVCGRIRLNTALGGRAGRGRTGLPGLIETYTSGLDMNTLDGAALIDLRPQVSQWFNALQGVAPTSTLTVISRILKGVPRVAPVISQVTSVQLEAGLGTRVSRLR